MPLILKHKKVSSADYGSLVTRVANILGTGAADKGYGQTLTATPVAAGSKVTAAQWEALRSDLNTLRKHQQGTAFDTSALPAAVSLNKLTDEFVNLYDAAITNVDTNSDLAAASEMLTANLGSEFTNSVQWGSNAADLLTLTQTFTFPTANDARYFFNSGGQLRVALSHANMTGSNNVYWHEILSKVGAVVVGGKSTTRTGVGTGSAIGYHQLTTSNQLLFSHSMTHVESSYSSTPVYMGGTNYVRVRGRRNSTGTQVILVVELLDVMGGIGNDVAIGTKAQFGYRKSAYFTIPTPTLNTSAAWALSDDATSAAMEKSPLQFVTQDRYFSSTNNVAPNDPNYWVVRTTNGDAENYMANVVLANGSTSIGSNFQFTFTQTHVYVYGNALGSSNQTPSFLVTDSYGRQYTVGPVTLGFM